MDDADDRQRIADGRDRPGGTPGGHEPPRRVLGQDVSEKEYRERHQTTEWILLPDEEAEVEVITTTPYKLLEAIQSYRVTELMGDVNEPKEVENVENVENVDVDVGVDDVDLDDVKNLGGFMRDFVVDRVVTPNGYWGQHDDPDGFDFSELTETDMTALIQGLIGIGNSFPGEQRGAERQQNSDRSRTPGA